MDDYVAGSICGLFFALILEIVSIFFLFSGSNRTAIILYSAAGILIYGMYVIIDLYMIVKRLEVDDYILGAFTLYLDLINLFMYILRILGSKK